MKKMIPVTVTSLALASCCLHGKPRTTEQPNTPSVVSDKIPDDYDSRKSDSGVVLIQDQSEQTSTDGANREVAVSKSDYEIPPQSTSFIFALIATCSLVVSFTVFVLYYKWRMMKAEIGSSNGNTPS